MSVARVGPSHVRPTECNLPRVVTSGGLSCDAAGKIDASPRWLACRPGFFLPVRVLSRVFRGKFLSGLRQALEQGKLALPPRRRPHLTARQQAVAQEELPEAGVSRSGAENPAENAWQRRAAASKVHRGQGRAFSNPHRAWVRGLVQLESILSAPPTSDCTNASPPRRSTQDSSALSAKLVAEESSSGGPGVG
jgi:hypothetical protein